MEYNPSIHDRHSIRLFGFDYSRPGLYYITLCSQQKKFLFGKIINDKMILNIFGKIVETEWFGLEKKFNNIKIDKFVVMPNHFHGIINIGLIPGLSDESNNTFDPVGAIHELPLRDMILRRKMLLPKIVGYFKMNSAKKINQLCKTPGMPVWQRNYYEHIIRDFDDYLRIVEYIEHNPEN